LAWHLPMELFQKTIGIETNLEVQNSKRCLTPTTNLLLFS